MKKASDKKENKKPVSKEEILSEIVPNRSIEKIEAALNEHKKKIGNSTVPFYSTKYGFKKVLVLYLNPDTPEEVIIQKFEKRLNSQSEMNNFKPKLFMKV
ncbi:MAG: hypothetical protein WCK78_04245 [Paludibacter sp.]